MRGVDKAERDVPLKLLQEKKKKEKMRKNMEKSFRNSKKKKKKGYAVEDTIKIIKIGKGMGMSFSDISQAVKDIEDAEERDRSSSMAKRTAKKQYGRNPAIKPYYRKYREDG